MPLFQKAVISKYLQTQNKVTIASKWNEFKNHFLTTKVQDDIKSLKEEQYQGEFLEDLFVKILGYTKPASSSETKFNLTTEYKNVKDSKKADGAIIINDVVKAVIELKGTNTTDLGKIESQAFGYKNNQPECVYVITSNFEKLRFYIDNAIEHIEFNLFTLTETEFELLYLCLAYDNIEKNIPKKIKDESLSQEDVITKKLYKDYSLFKRELHQNLTELNPDYDPIELFKKSQKLIDRFLFLFFGEDRHLLPPNSVRLILSDWRDLQERDEDIALYNRFKKYFEYLNTGFKGKRYDVFAYNGGLFKPDEILDNIKIDNELLYRHTYKLAEYDFASEVDVNILGHIFENSLNELDEVKAQLEGQEIDKTITKRKKDGVFYTPKYITKYIVENTIGKLCTEKKAELNIIEEDYYTDKKRTKATKQPLLEKLTAYRNWLLQLTICDPAVGSGAFLNQALDFLISEHRYIDELQAKLFGDSLVMSDVENSILENNLFGVDLNEESVEIAKLSLWLRTAQPNRKLNDLNNNIKCGNSLIDDPNIAGNKAFNWQTAFPKVFEKGGFDVIIGNPPYVRVQNLNHNEIDYFKSHKITAFKRVDISTLFFELSFTILKEFGILGFITSNQFQSTEYGNEIRKFIKTKFRIKSIIDFGDLPVFEGALTYVSIYCFEKNSPQDFKYRKIKSLDDNINIGQSLKIGLLRLEEDKWIFTNESESQLLKKLNTDCNLGKYGNAWAGLFTGKDDVLMFDIEGLVSSGIEKDLFLPVLRAEDMNRNGFVKASKYVIYPYKEENGKTVVLSEEDLEINYPIGYKYLLKNKELLQSRKDSRKTFHDRKDWYALTRFGTRRVFKQQKLVSPGEVKGHKFSIDVSGSGFSCARVFAITVNDKIDIKTLMIILNSTLSKFYLQRNSSLKAGGYYSYSSNVLNSFPICENIPKEFNQIAESIIIFQNELNELIQKFQRTIQRKFELEDLPKKLQDWYLLPYPEFIKELGKKKVKLSLSQEAEWEDYFIQESKKALELKTTIASTDKAIDKMVYELYGLSEEEIAIVENS
jgi:hypothetical protein